MPQDGTGPVKSGDGGNVYDSYNWLDMAKELGISTAQAYSLWNEQVKKGNTNPAGIAAAVSAELNGAGAGPGATAPSTSGSGSSGSGSSGSGSGSSGLSAKDLRQQQLNAEAGFMSYLRSWGMEVTPKLKRLITSAAKGNWNSQAFLIAVRGTEEYKQAFPGIQWRRGMSEATYNAQFDSYADRARDAGYKLTREGFAHVIKKGIDPQEWGLRVSAVKQVRANKDLLENFRQFLVDNGQLKPNEQLNAKDVYKLATGRGSPAWTNLWNTASVETGLEGIGFTVGHGGDLTRDQLGTMLKGPISKLGAGESLDMDFAALAKTAAEALPASRLYKSGITKKDLVTMALGGKNAAKIAQRVELAIGTARATASEQMVNPQLNQGGMQSGFQDRNIQATE